MWSPGALLNPGQASTAPAPAGTPIPAPPARPQSAGAIPTSSGQLGMSFQFTGLNGPIAVDFAGVPAAMAQPVPQHNRPTMPIFQNGLGQSIERLHNVQDRIAVPQPKRRKTMNENDPQPSLATHHSFAGTRSPSILTQHLKQNQQQPQQLQQTQQPQIQPGAPTQSTPAPRFETIDLTSNDTDNDNDVVMLSQRPKDPVKDEEVCFGMLEGAQVNCHRVPAPKPGMVSINGDSYWPQVKVVLKRKADETTSRIYIYDHTRQIFGTVDPKTADCLAPLLDSALQIRTDCRIPSRRKGPGEQIGQPVSARFKFDLMLYGPRKYATQVGNHMSARKMNLVSPPRVDPGVKVYNPMAKDNKLPNPSRSSNAGSSQQYRPPPIVRSVEEIRAEVLGVFDSLPKSDELPEAEADDRVLTTLLTHQRQALYFMTARESEQLPDAGRAIVTSTWQRKQDRAGGVVYYNVITNQAQREQPAPMLGGILADMMGLGKTLSVLSLITKTFEAAERWSQLHPVQPKAPERRPQNSSHRFEVPRPAAFELTPLRHNAKATLLLCPLSTITNWEEQIKLHIRPGSMSYYIYHGPNRIKDATQLAQFDLVITTYGSVVSELNSRIKGKRGIYPLEEIAWFRIVLDEAHTIREQNTLGFKAVCRLQASRRWAVTGTPVQNKLEDLAALLAFLRLKPFDERSKFLQFIIQPFKMADPEIVPKLRLLVDTITLRRLKDKIHLPARTDEVIRLDFSPEEQQVYDWFSKVASERVRVLTGQAIGQDRIVGGKTMIHILRSILQLRQICAHGKDMLNEDDFADLQGMTADTPIDLDSDDEDQSPEGNSDNCARCNYKLGAIEVDDPESDRQDDLIGYMARCFHTYCPGCIKWLRNEHNGCDVCTRFDKASCVELRRKRADMEQESRGGKNKGSTGKIVPDERYTGPHTKTRALVEELLANKERSAMCPAEPPLKSVVFSGWTSHLDLIQIALDSAGITYTRLDGKMTRTARNAAMDAFRDDHSVQVILVSITAGGLGLNLTAGNSVFVMEPQFNPGVEAQAVDRVHRLGQTRCVRTVRFIMKDSFEEKMLQLQDKKKKLASLSLDRDPNDKIADRTEAARQRLMDLRSLFK
ncbi:SNF2 family N-terminal domain-containing protein [Staphylotrichum tortipilum]|uniref:SNF2 family N-terminal domain-containing protein n=1 Tax=Staphylotrichum tortipilum TaxID=2831512 RepID=A0AAN6MRI0_9PEZI|nr:SNF2 family N-terminal domain-containing protein [Staphylotrichum longicolle]